MPDQPSTTILIVDDSRADVRLLQLWLRGSTLVRNVQVVRTGGEALTYLRQQGSFVQAPQPQAILLDIHLPDMLGWELFTELRRDASLNRIPVIVLTGSVNETDAQLANQLGAARYICKPFDADEFTSLVREIDAVIQESLDRAH